MVIKVGKKPDYIPENTFLKEALKELQKKEKLKGNSLQFDLEERENFKKQKNLSQNKILL